MLKKELRKAKTKALVIHLFISLLIFVAVAGFLIIYSYPSFYFGLTGGFRGLEMMFAIDMVIGPVLTLIVYNPRKSTRETIIDFSVIAVVQFAALAYGFHTVHNQRPKLLMMYQGANASAIPAYTVDGVESLHSLLGKTEFTIEGVKTIMMASVPTTQADPLSFDVMDQIKSHSSSGVAKQSFKLDYVNPLNHLVQLKQIDGFFRDNLKRDGFEDELKKHEKNHTNTWLFFIEGKYEGAYILLDEKFEFIAKIGAKET